MREEGNNGGTIENLEEILAAHMAKQKHKGRLYRQNFRFRRAYRQARDATMLNEETPCRDINSDAFWTGRGKLTVGDVDYEYTKSKIVTDTG